MRSAGELLLRAASRSVAALVACVVLAVCIGCGRPAPTTPDAPGEADGGVDTTEPAAADADAVLDVRELTDDELADRIARLREVIIPPAGTALASVDRVFGEPRVEEELREGAKGRRSDYPMHIYDLLAPKGSAEFRAFLYVTNRNDVVARAAINHHGVIKGTRAGSPRAANRRVEQQRVLLDLRAIRDKYRVQLAGAAWAR